MKSAIYESERLKVSEIQKKRERMEAKRRRYIALMTYRFLKDEIKKLHLKRNKDVMRRLDRLMKELRKKVEII